jgi:FkbM family methyltransferase
MSVRNSVETFPVRTRGFLTLLSEARGLRNKAALFNYILSPARRESMKRRQHAELFVELKHAKLWFGVGASELYPYIEVFVDDDYALSKIVLEDDSIILDIGANIGLFSLATAGRFSNPIYAFEPNPDAYSRLVKNVEANVATNVKPVNNAIYSSHCRIGFRLEGATTTGHIHKASDFLVEAVTLDDFCRQNSIYRVGLLKIDVEGAEIEILKGARETLGLTDWLVCECHSATLSKTSETMLAAQNFRKISEKKASLGGGVVLRFRKERVLH